MLDEGKLPDQPSTPQQPYLRRAQRRALQSQIRKKLKKRVRTEGHKLSANHKDKSISQEEPAILATDEEKEAKKKKSLDELKDSQLKIYSENCFLVRLMETGYSAEKAVKHLGISRTPRTARNLFSSYQEHGLKGLMDKRWFREVKATIFTENVKRLTLIWFFARPAAGHRAIWKKVCEECKGLKVKEPSETSVKQYLISLPESLKAFRKGKAGIKEWEQHGRPVIRYENTTYANERWQGDHAPLRFWVKVKVNGKWKPFKVYITVLLDAHTRALMGFVVSTKYPDSWVIALTFRRAILPKEGRKCKVCGIPREFESDRGKDFIAVAIAATLGSLGTIPDPDPPHYPNNKGKIERFIKSLDTGCLRILPGHMDAIGSTEGAALKRVHELLALQQLEKEIEHWIDTDYHIRKHSETGYAPAEYWDDTVKLNMPASIDDLNLLLLKYDKECTVLNIGIKFTLHGEKHKFWSPELAHYWKRKVRLRYNPEDMDSVLVYCAETGEYLCEAFDMLAENRRYTVEDIKRTRRQFRAGLLTRIRGYMAEVHINDRRASERAEREEARKLAEKLKAEERDFLPATTDEKGSSEIRDLISQFRQKDSANA